MTTDTMTLRGNALWTRVVHNRFKRFQVVFSQSERPGFTTAVVRPKNGDKTVVAEFDDKSCVGYVYTTALDDQKVHMTLAERIALQATVEDEVAEEDGIEEIEITELPAVPSYYWGR